MLKTSVCKVQAARAAGEHSLGAGSQSRMWVGSEDLASRRRPPAGPPGHREGIAEALSRGPRWQDSGDEVPPPRPGQGGHGTKPGQDMAERMLLERAGTHGKKPLGRCMSSSWGQVGIQRGILAIFVLPTYFMGLCVLPFSGSERIFTVAPGPHQARRVPARMGGQWNDALRQERGWSAWRRHK